MGHTNSTANLSLPQFIGTDKPTWLGDINGAFSTIDAYAGTNDAAVSAAASDASSAISQAATAVNTANTANTTAGNASTAANNAVGVANNAVAIAGVVDGKVGLLADLTTTDRTSIVNAINEVNAAIGTPTAAQVTYDNTGSGLTATNVQDAIDEVAQGGGGGVVLIATVTGDGTKTYAQLMDELFAHFSDINERSYLIFEISGAKYQASIGRSTASVCAFNCAQIGSTGMDGYSFVIGSGSAGHVFRANNGTFSDESATVVPNGSTIKLYA